MRQIELTQNQVALVDDADYEWLSRWKWYANWSPHTQSYYAQRMSREGGRRFVLAMHCAILGTSDATQGDHVNHDTLDNQRANLRLCTHRQNLCNQRKQAGRSSVYKGVSWFKPIRRWRAYIKCHGRDISLGYYRSEEEAGHAYNCAARLHFGDFANLNTLDI